jgi:hypothetical protein
LLTGTIGESYRYKFDLDDEFRSPADTPILLTLDGASRSVSGSVIRSESDKFIEIALDAYCGEVIQQAVLESRLDFIWEGAAKSLEEYQRTTPGLIDSIFAFSADSIYDASLNEDWGTSQSGKPISPNDQQRTAVMDSLRRSVTFVHGPPGTGKSVTIGWLTKELIAAGRERDYCITHKHRSG